MMTPLSALDRATWTNEPPVWRRDEVGLHVTTGHRTDFWQDTYYGFVRDDGHFLGVPIAGDFTAVVGFKGDYQVLYDQAGLMMRADGENWLKAGIEHSDGVPNCSVVVTRAGRSDWSVVGAPEVGGVSKVRLTRKGGAIVIHHQTNDRRWRMMRLSDFPVELQVAVGPMACSPERAGFEATFTEFVIGPPMSRPLHNDD